MQFYTALFICQTAKYKVKIGKKYAEFFKKEIIR